MSETLIAKRLDRFIGLPIHKEGNKLAWNRPDYNVIITHIQKAQLVRAPAFLHTSIVKVVGSNPAVFH